MKMRLFLGLVSLIFLQCARSQTLGGDAAYNFLKLSASPQLTALGGVNVSNISRDISLSFHNPSLLRPEMNKEFSGNFNIFYAGIRNVHAQMGYYNARWATTFTAGVDYFHYGSTDQTDASGNVMGSFNPYDYVVQVSASRQYLERWHYGATFKYIQSSYGQFRSNALAVDFGLNYYDSSSLLQVGFLARNMGFQLHTYGGIAEDMPFDLQLGITKRLKGSPFQFSLTAQRLHQFELVYNDTLFNADNQLPDIKSGFFNNLFRHFILATQVYASDKLEFTVGYNILRRSELTVYNSTNGLTGFSLGVGVLLKKFQFRYARSQYQSNRGMNQVGINLRL